MVGYVVFLDLETTGFKGPIRIIQIGALACLLDHRLTEIASFSQFVNPEKTVEPEAEEITGRSWDYLQSYPAIREALRLFSAFLRSLPVGGDPLYLVAHNGKAYDFPVLRREIDNCGQGLGIANIKCVDSIDAFRRYAETTEGANWPSYGLDAVSKRLLGTSRKGKHDALQDSQILRNCCAKIASQFVAFVKE